MRNGPIGFVVLFAATVAVGACGGGSGGGGTGGTSGATGGSSGATGGTSGGTGGSGSGGASGVTTLVGSRALNTLSASEATQLCADTTAYYMRSITKPNSCKITALSTAASSSAPNDTALQTACTNAERDCNQSATMGPGANTSCANIPATCAATVGQYSACIVDGTMVFNQAAGTLAACATVTRADFTPIFMLQETLYAPAGCMPLATACPDFAFPIAN